MHAQLQGNTYATVKEDPVSSKSCAFSLPLPNYSKDHILILPVVVLHPADIDHITFRTVSILKEFPDMVRQSAMFKINACAVIFL